MASPAVEAARHAIRAHVAADRIAATTARAVATFSAAFSARLVSALRRARTAREQREALLRFAASAPSTPELLRALRGTAGDALAVGARSAGAEVGLATAGSLTAPEQRDLAARLDVYAAETARRVRLGMLQEALDVLRLNLDTPAAAANAVEAVLAGDWGNRGAPRVELAATMTARSALSLGRMTVLRRPTSRAALPYWFFAAILDDRTSATCVECDDTVLPAGHSWWGTHTPLLHFHCRSAIVGVTAAQARKLGITKDPPKVDVPEGFGRGDKLCVLDKRPSFYARELLDRVAA